MKKIKRFKVFLLFMLFTVSCISSFATVIPVAAEESQEGGSHGGGNIPSNNRLSKYLRNKGLVNAILKKCSNGDGSILIVDSKLYIKGQAENSVYRLENIKKIGNVQIQSDKSTTTSEQYLVKVSVLLQSGELLLTSLICEATESN